MRGDDGGRPGRSVAELAEEIACLRGGPHLDRLADALGERHERVLRAPVLGRNEAGDHRLAEEGREACRALATLRCELWIAVLRIVGHLLGVANEDHRVRVAETRRRRGRRATARTAGGSIRRAAERRERERETAYDDPARSNHAFGSGGGSVGRALRTIGPRTGMASRLTWPLVRIPSSVGFFARWSPTRRNASR